MDPFILFALNLLAVNMDSPTVEWLFAHWIEVAIGGIAALLGWRNRGPIVGAVAKAVGVKPAMVEADGDPDWLDPEDHRATLSAALCLVSDHVHELGDAAGIEACKTLAPLVMLNCAPEPAPPAPAPAPVTPATA